MWEGDTRVQMYGVFFVHRLEVGHNHQVPGIRKHLQDLGIFLSGGTQHHFSAGA